jgi:hypothetical protein
VEHSASVHRNGGILAAMERRVRVFLEWGSMKRLVSAALGSAIALGAIGTTATAASARDWHPHPHFYRPGVHFYYGYGPGAAVIAGTALGLALGSALAPPYPAYAYPPPAPPPPPYPAYADADPHIDWCTATYPSYNGETDTWTDISGVPHRCIGP